MLVEAGADLDAREGFLGGTPLTMAVFADDAEMVRVLVENGSDVHAIQMFGLSPVQVAAALEHDAALATLIELGAVVAPMPTYMEPLMRSHRHSIRNYHFYLLRNERNWLWDSAPTGRL
jgi:ankyrin repeat protein